MLATEVGWEDHLEDDTMRGEAEGEVRMPDANNLLQAMIGINTYLF